VAVLVGPLAASVHGAHQAELPQLAHGHPDRADVVADDRGRGWSSGCRRPAGRCRSAGSPAASCAPSPRGHRAPGPGPV
jgi:hypothetical protein